MIKIAAKSECCACSACVEICPKKCIYFKEDSEGFLYPIIDKSECIDCHLCERVCPVIVRDSHRKPLQVFASYNPDEQTRFQSSSGGIFTMLAKCIIDRGGIVFGASFNDDWQVCHTYVETMKELEIFSGSKYVQSNMGDCFSQVKRFLQDGREVLFSGTPCQVSGLHKFLRNVYPNLFTLDFICHGVPSPGVFRVYLKEILQKYDFKIADIKSISFRDKIKGWKRYSFTIRLYDNVKKEDIIISKDLKEDPFLKGFLNDLYLRPSCHECPSRGLSSRSDITIGDYWGYAENNDDKGISAVIINSSKGKNLFNSIQPITKEADFDDLSKRNPAIFHSSSKSTKRNNFFNDIASTSFEDTINGLCRPSGSYNIKNILLFLRRVVYKIINR